MRKITMFLLAGSMLFMTSCLNIIEDIYLNKDGSGKYVMMFDMSGLFENPFMKSAMEEQTKKDGAEDVELEKDSIMYYKDMFQEGDLNNEEMTLIKDLGMHLVMSKKNNQFYIKTEFPFSSFEEYNKINAVLSKLKKDDEDETGEDAAGGMGGLGSMFGAGGPMGDKPQFLLKRRKLTRSSLIEENQEEMDEETKGYMNMLLGDATIKTTYHLPGKVKKTTIPNAIVNGKIVTVENGFLDIIEQKAKVDGYIKYKRR